MSPKKGVSRNKLNLFVDLGIALAFVVEMEEHFSGLRVHELLGLAFGAAIIVHLILHWQWIVGVTRRFFQNLFHESRFNYLLNTALYVDMAVVIISGILISRTIGLQLGLNGGQSFPLQTLHTFASQLCLVIVGLHVAVHWKWIVTHSQKYLFNFRALLPAHKARTVQSTARSSSNVTVS